jgi:hypothetical protein
MVLCYAADELYRQDNRLQEFALSVGPSVRDFKPNFG